MIKKYLKTFIFSLLLVLLLYYFRAWFHGFVMFFYINPVILQVTVVTLILHFLVFKRISAFNKDVNLGADTVRGNDVYAPLITILTPVLFIFLLIVGLILSNWFTTLHIVKNTEYAFRDNLAESSNNLRLMPFSVAQRYAKDSLQLSQYKLGSESIVLVDDKMSWIFPLVPDGFVIQFTKKNKGVVYVNATEQSRNSKNVWDEMEIGEGMYITDNLFWNIFRHRYFVNIDKPYYLIEDEEVLTCLSAVSYSFHFKYGIPYTVPNFEGVFVVDTDGEIDLLSPEEAQDHPGLSTNRIFPESLARIYVAAYEYHLGVLNKLFVHEDQIQIQDVADTGSRINRQPYLMDTTEGLKWFISTEPYGASHGIFKIFTVDAKTGEIEIFELPTDQTLTGPVKSVDYVRRSNPVVDWSRFDSVEPLPFVRDQKLFWKLSVIPEDSAGIAYQAFVDAHSNDVYELTEDEDIVAFLKGEVVENGVDLRDTVIEELKEKFDEMQELFERLEL